MKETPNAGAFGTIATFLFGSMLHMDKAMQDEITFWAANCRLSHFIDRWYSDHLYFNP